MALAGVAEKARKVVEIASDKQASDIVLLDLRGLAAFADYFVICSGETERQLRAIYEAIDEALGKEGVAPQRREGSPESGWVLLDCGDLIVHIFSLPQRQYYRLEEVWSRAIPLVRIQ